MLIRQFTSVGNLLRITTKQHKLTNPTFPLNVKRLCSTTTATAAKASTIKRFEACHCNYKVDVCVDDQSCLIGRGDIVCSKTVKVDACGVDKKF